ncbi:MAG TPA: DUF2723 domain-containing protein [Candidatus Enterocola sp.]|nr:DUF2723 domain-containing protein [Candidatus Enterocola sp.]
MKRFNIIDKLTGLLVFAIAMVTYALTIEPTASFWDCSEFISTAAKLEVGHPPGAPFFMLTGKFFSLFASDTSQIAMMINLMSAFLSALTILFLFWTITHLARKVIVSNPEQITVAQLIAIIGSGIVGSLAYTFSDTFWFSAVEGEVYAYSSFLTAIAFWLILKWEDHANEENSDRYLVLICYLMGLSIGVHLLNLLTIPAIVLVYYYKKNENHTWKGILTALLVSFAILALVLYGMVPGFITLAGYVELLFVNSLGLPFNTGALFYCALTVCVLIWSIFELYKNERKLIRIQISSLLSLTLLGVPFIGGSWIIGLLLIAGAIFYFYFKKDKLNIRMLSTVIVSMAAILIGYSCYSVIVIRSVANPPMDQNSPDNVFSLKNYLNREQYGDRPLVYGPYYSSEPELETVGDYCQVKTKEGEKTWGQKEKTDKSEKDEYIVTGTKYSIIYNRDFQTIFPRMHSNTGDHPKAYESWVNVKGKEVKYDRCGRMVDVKIPTFGENLEFFFSYQLNYMYWRYFLWNFSGRQNDIQGHGEVTNGNWITGFNFIDKYMVGDQTNLPPMYLKNKAHNAYYMLPLILGIIGIVFQIFEKKSGKQSFWVTFVLFFMTGIAIVLYLNQGPSEPRERDYAYAGSFYAFTIWIGFGVAGIAKFLQDRKLPAIMASVIALIISLPVPALMAYENWDDHDRSNRFVARDFGLNYFNSCSKNAIIFTNGDNDTFPLWYTQETEGTEVSLDKRVCNLSYLQTDWYIDQMRRPAYKSEKLPIAWERKTYVEGKRDIVYLDDLIKGPIDLKYALDNFLASDDPQTKTDPRSGKERYYLPCKKFKVPVNFENLVKQGAVDAKDRDKIASEIIIDLSDKRYLSKSELMILDMIANNNWERPIYYAVTVGSDMYLNLDKYFQLEGLCYRIVPFADTKDNEIVNTDAMYNNMMNKFKFGNIDDQNVYLDENILRMCMAQRQMFGRLIDALIKEDKKDKALKALNYCLDVIPGKTVAHNYSSTSFVEYYYALGEKEKGRALAEEIASDARKNLQWLSQFKGQQRNSAMQDIAINLGALQNLTLISRDYDAEAFDKYYKMFIDYEGIYQSVR